MAVKMPKHPVQCFAATTEHPVLSLNDEDVQCGISGRLQPSEGSPCCGEYSKCGIWRTTKDLERAGTRVDHRYRDGSHTLGS